MAKKIDLSGVKEFLFNHGEKVALGSCAVLGVILGLWGVFGAAGAGNLPGTGKSYADVFKTREQGIQAGINQPAGEELLAKAAPTKEKDDWNFYKSTHIQGPLIAIADFPNDKRQRPRVLAIRTDKDSVSVEYMNALVYYYDKDMTPRQERGIKGLELPDAPLGGVGPGPGPGPAPKFPRKEFGQPAPGGGAGAALPFAKIGQPHRLVVVHARFPMKQQVIEFQKALRMASQDDLFKNRDDLPKPVGLDVIRVEVLGPDKVSEPEVIVGIYDTPKFQMNKKLEQLLRNAIYDERSPEMMKENIWAGLTMPMPKLANRHYPKFDIKGFEFDWAMLEDDEARPDMAAGGRPVMPGPGPRGGKEFGPGPLPGFGKGGFKGEKKFPGPGMENDPREAAVEYNLKLMTEKQLRDTNPGLITRVFGGKEKRIDQDLNVFHVLGQFEPVDENAAVGPGPGAGPGPRGQFGGPNNQDAYFHAWDIQMNKDGVQGPSPGPGPGPGTRPVGPPRGFEKKGTGARPFEGPGGAAAGPVINWDRDAVVRFIDADVRPGKTYKYFVRVRMANPNFNKTTKEVAFDDLTRHAELPPSEWVEIPKEISIPQEYNLYAMDQQLLDDWDASVGTTPKKGPPPFIKDTREILSSTPFQIHQWVTIRKDNDNPAEHVIGDWVVLERKMVKKGEPIGVGLTVHAPVWYEKKDAFEVTLNRAISKKEKGAGNIKGIHVDMIPDGGKPPILVDFHGGKRLWNFNLLLEETAVDALILMPDGKLKVLNSRDATDPAAGNNPEAKERADRVLSVRRRLDEVTNGSGGGGNPAMPKGRPAGPSLPGSKGP